MAKTPEKPEVEPELRPDGWERFEKAVDVAVTTKAKVRKKQSTKSSDVAPPSRNDLTNV